jgi:hypothetical protein
MKVSTQLVIALNNGTDQVVSAGDFREIHDADGGQGRPANGRERAMLIEDGASVVIGGEDLSPDFGMEGIVVNIEENRQADGGKMCLVMLNDDTSKILPIPIARLLTGLAAKEAVARKAALRALHDKVSPGLEELLEVVQCHRRNGLGAKKIINKLRHSHPDWEVSEKRVKKCLKDLEWRDHGAGEGAKTSAPPESVDAHAEDALDDDEDAMNISDTVRVLCMRMHGILHHNDILKALGETYRTR